MCSCESAPYDDIVNIHFSVFSVAMATLESDTLWQANPLMKGVNNHILYRFITLYRERPVLWNSSLKIYGDRNEKLKAYKELLIVLKDLNKDATIIDVKKKINSLRTNFRKRVKDKMNASTSAEDIYESSNWMDRELRFLAQGLGEHSDNSSGQDEAAPPIKVEVISDWDADIDDQFHQDNASTVALAASPTQTPKRKLQNQNFDSDGDEDEYNAKRWMGKLKSMRSEQKQLANKFINDLLTQGEMGTLDPPNTSDINEYLNGDIKPASNSSPSFNTDPLYVNNNSSKNHVCPSIDSNISKRSTTSYESLHEKEHTSTSYEYLHNREQPKQTRCPEKEDEFDVVGRRIAYQLRGMEERQCLIAEKLLSDIMFQGRLGKLDENSSLRLTNFGLTSNSA